MKVVDLVKELDLKILVSDDCDLNREIKGGYVSDLLSDVMGNADEGQVWITLQTHKNVAAIATLKDLAAVILVKDYLPDDDTREQAQKEGIPILGTSMETFDVAGKLYKLLNNEKK